jgi:hypothetical protein
MRLLALPLVQPHAPPRLHKRRLNRRVRSLLAVAKGGILRLGEPVGSVSLQGSELFDQRREVASSFGALPPAFQQVADYGPHCLYRLLRLPRFGLTPSMHDLIATLRMQLEGIPERLILDGVSG